MKAALTRLRIAGFKSFAEPVALDILPGLTGIVGPNGCGKSNVVEALRWAMGETSARALRGGDMDDVIFAGTVARPSRNLAEVTITLEGDLPDPYAAEAELALTRRIERGAGSSFRGNGREMRARDVQTFYADLASGARSSGMVSQGRVAALVGAKPEDRRQVLEEAAGITGLHARRHEAELKLRATEQNLSRAEDLRGQLETVGESLRKQARAAARYRNISGLIRAADLEHLAILLGQALATHTRALQSHAESAKAEAAAVEAVSRAGLAITEAEAALAQPREREAACRSALERRRMEAESLAADVLRAGAALAEAQARSLDIESDLADSARARHEAEAAASRLQEEAAALSARLLSGPAALAAAKADQAEAEQAENLAAHAADQAADAAAQAAADARQAELVLAQATRLADASRTRHEHVLRDHEAQLASRIDTQVVAQAEAAADTARLDLQRARDALKQADNALAQANAAAAAAKLAWQKASAEHAAASGRRDDARRRAEIAAETILELADAAAACEATRVPDAALRHAASAAETARAEADEAEQALALAESAARMAEARRQDATLAAARAGETRQFALAAADDASRRADALASEIAETQTRMAAAEQARPGQAMRAQAEAALVAATEQLAACQAGLHAATDQRVAAEARLAGTRTTASAAAAEAQRLAAEIEGLGAALSDGSTQSRARAVDLLEVPPGLEAAVAAALGEAADFSLDPDAPRYWALLPDHAAGPLPAGTATLARLIAAPAALSRALSHAALVESDDEGGGMQALLSPGQVVVTKAGAAWRWDGRVTRAGAQSTMAARLRQRNRLQWLGQAHDAARAAQAEAERAALEAEREAELARAAEGDARDRETVASHAVQGDAARCDALASKAAEAAASLQSLRAALARLMEAHVQASDEALHRLDDLQKLADPADAQAALARAEAALTQAQEALDQAHSRQQRTRMQAQHAQDEARRVEAAAAAAQQRALLIEPQLGRARQEHAAALAAWQQAGSLVSSLTDPAVAEAEAERASAAAGEASAQFEVARAARADAEQLLETMLGRASQVAAEHQRVETALAAQETLLAQALLERNEAAAALATAIEARAGLPDAAERAAASAEARTSHAASRRRSMQAEAALQALQAEMLQSERRRVTLAYDQAQWLSRLGDAQRRFDQLVMRADAARRQCATLASAVEDVGRRAGASGAMLAEAEQAHAAAAADLLAAEGRVRDAVTARRQADSAEADSRAALVRAEAMRDAAEGGLAAVHARIAERLAGQEANVPEAADISDAAEERARRRAERLAREREEMGPVNLRAEVELAELEQKAAAIERERDELTSAVAKLRGAIGHLNREGRARLTQVFTEVDRHFRTLFTRMMGGGCAHLALTGSDDPLLAGLEIYAEPPGKKLSALSLLSGGEQALTALSLIFAVFRCTPAPVSVLDEVDAPLDDANVERFCTLLDEMVRDTGTRFLVVTHHQVTMSRMDRLFGVTMQERGVSRLLSVDLQRAAALIAEETLQAAE
jgi:chromosome segregation protein